MIVCCGTALWFIYTIIWRVVVVFIWDATVGSRIKWERIFTEKGIGLSELYEPRASARTRYTRSTKGMRCIAYVNIVCVAVVLFTAVIILHSILLVLLCCLHLWQINIYILMFVMSELTICHIINSYDRLRTWLMVPHRCRSLSLQASQWKYINYFVYSYNVCFVRKTS